MGEVHHNIIGPPCTREGARMESAQQTTTTPQANPQEPLWDTGYGGAYSGHHESGSYYPYHSYPEPSLHAGTSASTRYPDWYAPLERYTSYEVYQAGRAVEGSRRLERWIYDFAHVQTKMQATIDSQTSKMLDIFGHFGINPDA
jgi:hypothetical protein